MEKKSDDPSPDAQQCRAKRTRGVPISLVLHRLTVQCGCVERTIVPLFVDGELRQPSE